MVGLGGIGQRHLRNIRALFGDAPRITAFRVRNRPDVLTDALQLEPGADLASRWGIAQVFTDLDAALADGPDVVFVCNPSSLHIPTALAAARGGCHLFIEKPLSHDWEGVEELIAEVERRKLVAYVGYQLRFHPCLRRVRDLLTTGAVGRVLAVRAEVGEYLPAWHRYEDYREMYASRRDLGGGVVLSQIHEMDYLYWLLGKPTRLFAIGGHLSSLEVDVDDVASILMEFTANGQVLPVHLHQDYVQRPPRRTLQVVGDQGKIDLDFHALSVTRYDAAGELVERFVADGFVRNQLFLDELTHFFGCVAGRETPEVDVRDGAQSLRMALAAHESLTHRRIVELS
jgi:predicted dehydrogenase